MQRFFTKYSILKTQIWNWKQFRLIILKYLFKYIYKIFPIKFYFEIFFNNKFNFNSVVKRLIVFVSILYIFIVCLDCIELYKLVVLASKILSFNIYFRSNIPMWNSIPSSVWNQKLNELLLCKIKLCIVRLSYSWMKQTFNQKPKNTLLRVLKTQYLLTS